VRAALYDGAEMHKSEYAIAVVGATGLVGAEIINLLVERSFPFSRLALYASERTAGGEVAVEGRSITVELLDRADFQGIDIAFFASAETVAAEWGGRATEAGAVVIDLSPLYASEADVPLVVPEVNAAAIAGYATRRIIASPDAAALQLAVVLQPLSQVVGLRRVVVSSYQPVSQLGRAGVEELSQQTVALLNGRDVEVHLLPHRIAFNLMPQVGEFLHGGYTRGEQQLVEQTRRLLDDPGLPITATGVRVPLFFGLSQSVNLEMHDRLTAADAREVLRQAPGLLVQDDPNAAVYPVPANAIGSDATCVGRIRDDDSADNAINLWISGDNLRQGSALNAVAIAEVLIREYL
jgi:aspartate-semialdehyde dehydrogenase